MTLSSYISCALTHTSVLQQHSGLNKNQRLTNNTPHRYPICSKPTNNGTNFRYLAAQYLIAQHLFNPHNAARSHIYRADGNKETMDTLLDIKIEIFS